MDFRNHSFILPDPPFFSCSYSISLLLDQSDSCSSSFVDQKDIEKTQVQSIPQIQISKKELMNKDRKSFGQLKKEINPTRRKFTEEEDRYLSQLVNEMGAKNWESIAKKMTNRTARQCRDRYSNYLIPGFFNGEWSTEEDENLFKKYQEFGPKWTIIQKYFKNRSPNSLKNRWNYFVSRKDFKLQMMQNSCSTNTDKYNFCKNLYEQNNLIQQNYIQKNHQLFQYCYCYNQIPINFAPNNNSNQVVSSYIQNDNRSNRPIIFQKKNIKSQPKIHPNKNIQDLRKVINIDQGIDQLASIDESNNFVFQLNFESKNSSLFGEEINDYDNNIYNFDDSELFSF